MSHPCCICRRSGFFAQDPQGAETYCHVHRTEKPVVDAVVRRAQKGMARLNYTLDQAARINFVDKNDLDLAMWKSFGRSKVQPGKPEVAA